MVLSIVYASEAAKTFTQQDLDALLVQSRDANERDALTGVLVHRGGRFLQLIEGPDDSVRSRMDAIERDPRHGRIRVLIEEEVDDRRFPEWTMGYEGPSELSDSTPGFRRTFDDIDDDRSTSGTLPALRALIAWFRERHDG